MGQIIIHYSNNINDNTLHINNNNNNTLHNDYNNTL